MVYGDTVVARSRNERRPIPPPHIERTSMHSRIALAGKCATHTQTVHRIKCMHVNVRMHSLLCIVVRVSIVRIVRISNDKRTKLMVSVRAEWLVKSFSSLPNAMRALDKLLIDND